MLTWDVWFALLIATLGTGTVLFYSRGVRKEEKTPVKILLYALISTMAVLWLMVVLVVAGVFI